MNGKLVQCAAQIKEQTKLFLAILEHISKKDLTHISSDAAGLWAGLIVSAKNVYFSYMRVVTSGSFQDPIFFLSVLSDVVL